MELFNELEVMHAKRQEIAEIDNQILFLLERRIEAAEVIGDIKRKNNKPVYAPDVEKQKIAVLAKKSSYPGLVETIWPVIMCYTRSVE